VKSEGESRLKTIGLSVLFPIGFIVLLLLSLIMLRGMVWALDKAYPFILAVSDVAFAICLFIFLPMYIFRKTRPWAGVGFVYASYSFGLLLFAYSCFFVVDIWGYGGLAVGLLFAGAGVVPVALLAALFHAQWSALGQLAFGIFLTFGTRFLGIHLSDS
jgi:hypothetical protein